MRLTIPLTGIVLVEGSLKDSSLTGDSNDPIRPIDIDLGNVSWRMVDVDLENEVMVIEVEPGNRVAEPDLDTGGEQKLDTEGNPIYKTRQATEQEKFGFLQYAQDLIAKHTRDELYEMAKQPRIKRPFKGKEIRSPQGTEAA